MGNKQSEINSQQNRNGRKAEQVNASLQIKNPGSGGITPPDKKPTK